MKDIYAYSLSGLCLSGLGTIAGNSDRIAKKPWGHVNKDGVITDLSPKGSLEEVHLYVKFAKVTSWLAGVGFATLPESGGTSALLIGGAGAIDVGTAVGVTWGEDWLYKKFGIK